MYNYMYFNSSVVFLLIYREIRPGAFGTDGTDELGESYGADRSNGSLGTDGVDVTDGSGGPPGGNDKSNGSAGTLGHGHGSSNKTSYPFKPTPSPPSSWDNTKLIDNSSRKKLNKIFDAILSFSFELYSFLWNTLVRIDDHYFVIAFYM
jgi:hypothetical protein